MRSVSESSVRDLAIVDIRDHDRALARLARRGWAVDAVILSATPEAAARFDHECSHLSRTITVVVPSGGGDEVAGEALAQVARAVADLAGNRPDGYQSLISIGTASPAHLAAGLIKRGMPGLAWYAETPAEFDRFSQVVRGTIDAFADEVAGPSPSAKDGEPLVTVAIATHHGEDRITACLDSIATQTSLASLEIVVVDNGPDFGTARVVSDWASAHAAVSVAVVRSDIANVALARNLALDEARGQYVAFVDDDDRLAPRYLEGLLPHASTRRVPIAMPLVAPDGDFEHLEGPLGTWGELRRHVGHSYHQSAIQMVWAPAWAKLISTDVARRVRFDERLSNVAEDVVFCLRAAATEDLRLVLTDLSDDAAYLYARRSGGLTRPVAPTFDTHVDQPLVAIAAIAEVGVLDRDELREVGWRVVAHAAKRIDEYRLTHRADHRAVAMATAPYQHYLEVVATDQRTTS